MLSRQQIPYILLEAKAELGGRISAATTDNEHVISYDLGPTWVFPHQHTLLQLIKTLKLTTFEQYCQGDVLYQSSATTPCQQIPGAGEMQLFRLAGGMHSLIKALYQQLDPATILTEHAVIALNKQQDSWHITAEHHGKLTHFRAQHVIAALPPRMIINHLTPAQWAEHTLLKRLATVPTWMAGQAKFIATFEHAFWRDKNLSGQCFSRVGPLVEVHDASAAAHEHPALFGFIGIPYSERKQLTNEQLKHACLKQLAYFYGAQVYNATHCFIKDWAADPYVANEQDTIAPSQHPEFSFSGLSAAFTKLNIHFVASEFAQQEAGYLAGALSAVDKAMNDLQFT